LKFNLKTRPRFGTALQRDSAIVFAQKYEEWFEGFEKELRKMLWSTVPDLEIQGWNKALKKILGEAT